MAIYEYTGDQLNRLLDRMLEEANEARRALIEEWYVNEQYLRAAYRSPSQRHRTNVYSNQLYRVIQHYQAMLTDARPAFNVEVAGRSRWPIIVRNALHAFIERYWREHSMDRFVAKLIPPLFACGKTYAKVIWDRELYAPRVHHVHPVELYIDPAARTLDEAEWICQKSVVSMWELYRRYPPSALEGVRVNTTYSSYPYRVHESAISRYGYQIGPGQYATLPPGPGRYVPVRLGRSAVERTDYEEWLIRDPRKDENGDQAYPTCRVVIRAGGKILADGQYPYWDPWPGWWVECWGNHMGYNVYGHPELTQWVRLQEALNVVLRLAVDNVRFLTPGLWMLDIGAVAAGSEEHLRPDIGAIVRKRQGMEIKRDSHPLPPGLLDTLNLLRSELLYVTGLNEATAGRPPRSVTAAAAIEALGQTAVSMARPKAREIEQAMVGIGIRILSRVLQYYDEEAFAALIRSAMDQDTSVPASELLKSVGIERWDYEYRYRLLRDLRISVRPGSSMAVARDRDTQYWLALYAAGLVSRKTVREILQIPGREEDERAELAQAMVGSPAATAQLGPTPRGRGVRAAQLLRR